MTSPRLTAALLALLLMHAVSAHANWWESLLKKAQDMQGKPMAEAVGGALSDDEIVRGLKEALSKGADRAIARLGRPGGYLDNVDVRIPLPEELQRIDKLLRTFRQDRYADEFVATMNRAAERAVPEAALLLKDSVAAMSLDDARAILKGADDAATQYFRRTSEDKLRQRFLPIVRQATEAAGVTAAYKAMLQRAGPAAGLLGEQARDVDGYVTAKAMDGLFRMMALEEKAIREHPVERTTDLLKRVFGAGR